MLGKIKIGDIEFSRSGDLEIKCVVHEATKVELARVGDRLPCTLIGRKWTSYGRDPAEAFANALRCVADVLV